ncbi:MAG: hypothetical protein JW902_07740 [Syntrophaceae bacterium]|nr:hypothetical protein [Syntrophaceae bacterium]
MFKVRFADNSEFIGGEPQDSRWNGIPSKPIACLQYSLLGVNILMKGFQSYNHLVEHTVILNNNAVKVGGKTDRISRIILMGEWCNRIYEVIYDLGQGRVYQQVRGFQKESAEKNIASRDRTGITGWKKGTFDPHVSPAIRRV